jgi:hypothetical protein
MVCEELKKAIERKTYKPAQEPERTTWSIDNLEGLDQLDEDDRAKVLLRIESKNSGEDGYHCHRGVGGVVTMDLAGMFGGRGRGDARLQFLPDGGLRIVDHDNRKMIG